MPNPGAGSYVFSNVVADPDAIIPTSLNLTLNNNGVSASNILLGNVKAVLFNAIDPTGGSSTPYEFEVNGLTTTVEFEANYDGETIALVLETGESYLVELDFGATTQYLSTYNGFDSVGPEKIRKWGLEVGGF